jgi:hypothetical protein
MAPTDMVYYDNYDIDWTVVQPIRTPKTWGLFSVNNTYFLHNRWLHGVNWRWRWINTWSGEERW